jgi:hypothetical protein
MAAHGVAQARLAGGVETFEHFRMREPRRVFADARIQTDLALLDELHDGDGRDRFCHGGDAEDCVELHALFRGDVLGAKCAFVKNAISRGGNCDDARDAPGVDVGLQDAVSRRIRRLLWRAELGRAAGRARQCNVQQRRCGCSRVLLDHDRLERANERSELLRFDLRDAEPFVLV